MSILALHDYVAKKHKDHEIVKCVFKKRLQENEKVSAIIGFDTFVKLKIPAYKFVEPYRRKLIADELLEEEELEFDFSYNANKRSINLDMRPIERGRKAQETERLLSQLHKGDIVEAEVLSVNDKNAKVKITNTNVESFISRDELSPNKVVRASDEVFVV